MGDAVTIGCLIIDSGDMSEGSSKSARAWACVAIGGSGCGALDDSSGLEVLALLAGGRRTKLSGCKVVALGVVGGLLISYLHWGAENEGLVGAPPSEGGIRGAFTAWNGESLDTWAVEALCLGVRRGEGARRAPQVRAMSKMEKWPRVRAPMWLGEWVCEVMCAGEDIKWRGMRSQGGRGKWGIHRVFGVCEMEKLGVGGLKMNGRDFSFLHSVPWVSHNMQNGIGGAKLIRKPLRFSYSVPNGVRCANFFACSTKISWSVQNEFARCFYFSTVCEIFAPYAKWFMNFACPTKISQGLRIYLVFPLFEVPLQLIIKNLS